GAGIGVAASGPRAPGAGHPATTSARWACTARRSDAARPPRPACLPAACRAISTCCYEGSPRTRVVVAIARTVARTGKLENPQTHENGGGGGFFHHSSILVGWRMLDTQCLRPWLPTRSTRVQR